MLNVLTCSKSVNDTFEFLIAVRDTGFDGHLFHEKGQERDLHLHNVSRRISARYELGDLTGLPNHTATFM